MPSVWLSPPSSLSRGGSKAPAMLLSCRDDILGPTLKLKHSPALLGLRLYSTRDITGLERQKQTCALQQLRLF